uniref:NUC153 domain-containing protein n=1 Tax=Heterorhabditis bacteriophora TaxID=37862 RepID=A0A1I7XKG5_HETBA
MDLARGEGNILSSSDDSDSEWELTNDINVEIDLAHLDNDAEQVEWASRRLAVCNLDWDMVKCEDVLVLVNSFKETKLAMRKYQMDRLKYYYAVIECDNEETASAIYEHCDGLQFESSGLKMDLRFVPDDMEFELKSCVSLTNGRLAWDENDEQRAKRFEEAFINDGEGADLVADSDSDMDDGKKEENRKAILALLHHKDESGKLQVDWTTENIKGDDIDSDVNESDEGVIDSTKFSSDDEEIFKDIQTNPTRDTEKKNTYKDYLEKRKAKRKEKKQKIREVKATEKEQIADGSKKKIKTNSTKAQDELKVDERFRALFTDSAFAIEQSSTMFKGSKLMMHQVEAKKNAKEHRISNDDMDIISKLKNKSAKWPKKY